MKRLSISSYVANILLTFAWLCSSRCLTYIKVLTEHRLVEILLYGDNNCNEIANKLITEATIAFIKLSKRFDT